MSRITTARRVKFHEAKRYFLAGGRVLVAERDKGLTMPVTEMTTTHAGNTDDWNRLAETVREWRTRYPRQRFYIVNDPLS